MASSSSAEYSLELVIVYCPFSLSKVYPVLSKTLVLSSVKFWPPREALPTRLVSGISIFKLVLVASWFSCHTIMGAVLLKSGVSLAAILLIALSGVLTLYSFTNMASCNVVT